MKWGPCGSRCGRGVGRRPHHNGTHTDEADAQRGGGRRGSERLGRFCAMRCTFDVAGDNTVSRLAVPLVLVLDEFLLLRGPQPLQFCKVVLACFLALQLQALLLLLQVVPVLPDVFAGTLTHRLQRRWTRTCYWPRILTPPWCIDSGVLVTCASWGCPRLAAHLCVLHQV